MAKYSGSTNVYLPPELKQKAQEANINLSRALQDKLYELLDIDSPNKNVVELSLLDRLRKVEGEVEELYKWKTQLERWKNLLDFSRGQ